MTQIEREYAEIYAAISDCSDRVEGAQERLETLVNQYGWDATLIITCVMGYPQDALQMLPLARAHRALAAARADA